jgi:hypothetical protein
LLRFGSPSIRAGTITNKTGRAVRFVPNTAQLRLLDEAHSLNLILKTRQLGFTTLCCLVYLNACLFSRHTRAGVITHRLNDGTQTKTEGALPRR